MSLEVIPADSNTSDGIGTSDCWGWRGRCQLRDHDLVAGPDQRCQGRRSDGMANCRPDRRRLARVALLMARRPASRVVWRIHDEAIATVVRLDPHGNPVAVRKLEFYRQRAGTALNHSSHSRHSAISQREWGIGRTSRKSQSLRGSSQSWPNQAPNYRNPGSTHPQGLSDEGDSSSVPQLLRVYRPREVRWRYSR